MDANDDLCPKVNPTWQKFSGSHRVKYLGFSYSMRFTQCLAYIYCKLLELLWGSDVSPAH